MRLTGVRGRHRDGEQHRQCRQSDVLLVLHVRAAMSCPIGS
jgi:hypothetical protein